jgi:hypothetical protein
MNVSGKSPFLMITGARTLDVFFRMNETLSSATTLWSLASLCTTALRNRPMAAVPPIASYLTKP